MGANGQEEKPPAAIEDRRAPVHTDGENTIEFPFDPFDPDFQRYFDTGAGMRPIRAGNEVKAFISGVEAFSGMGAGIETATGPDHYIYMLNWFIDLSVPVKDGRTLESMLLTAEQNHVQIRGMFWDQPLFQNSSVVNRFNDTSVFPGAAAILDNNTINNFPVIPALVLGLPFFIAKFLPGSHHQKLLIVKGEQGLLAFMGGVDWNFDRIRFEFAQNGSPMHDVHCRIEGPAAHDLLQVFINRWNDHPQSRVLKNKGVADLRGVNEPVPGVKGDKHIQIGCTFGDGKAHGGISNVNGGNFYSFAPEGERSAERIAMRAVVRAEQFIYIEDQYMVGTHLAVAINVALGNPKLKRVIILIPHSSLNPHPNAWRRRKEFVTTMFRGLSQDQIDRVTICYRKLAGLPPDKKFVAPTISEAYIHAKMMIVDDRFASIGSMNCGLRSYSNDSEFVAGIYDECPNPAQGIHFAHDLRIRLWAKHLRLPPAQVFDPVASAVHWVLPSNSSSVGVYDPDADTDSKLDITNLIASDFQAEPYGGIPGKELTP